MQNLIVLGAYSFFIVLIERYEVIERSFHPCFFDAGTVVKAPPPPFTHHQKVFLKRDIKKAFFHLLS